MDERYKKINQFLKYISSIAMNNLDFKLTEGAVYGELTRIGVTEYDRFYDVSDHFSTWINMFDEKKNIKAFNQENWKYFCQFTNLNNNSKRTAIKMYIPLTSAGILNGANILFNYLEKSNIHHTSKIGSHIRNDDIIVRVYTKEDALEVARFVNSDEYIKKNLINPNPFMLNDGNIAYATDANLSYSDQMSAYVFSYLYEASIKKELNNVNVDGLLNSIINTYNNVFINGDFEQIKNFEVFHRFDGNSKSQKIISMANAAEVTKLIIYSLNGENDLNRVMQVYDELNNHEYMKDLEQKISYNYDKMSSLTMVNSMKIDENEILREAVLTTLEKYGYEHTKKALAKFTLEGDSTGITRANNVRNNLEKNITSSKASEIINSICNSVNFDLYINYVLEKKALSYKEEILENACLTTLKKYNIKQLDVALKNAIKGNFIAFTNDDHCRENLINNINSKEIEVLMKDILIRNNIDNNMDIQIQFLNLMEAKLQERKTNNKNNIRL